MATHPSDIHYIGESIASGNTDAWTWEALPVTIVLWLTVPVFTIAYSLWCSRLMASIISSIEGKAEPEADRLLRRYWGGTVLFSGALWTSGFSVPIIVSLLMYLGTVLLPSTPVILVYLGSMRRRNPSRPTWQIVLTGIGLIVGTMFALLLGSLVYAVIGTILSIEGLLIFNLLI